MGGMGRWMGEKEGQEKTVEGKELQFPWLVSHHMLCWSSARQRGTDQYSHLSHVNHPPGRAQTLPVLKSAHSRVPGTALLNALPIGPHPGTAHQ